jgi:hypothetical protein
MARPRKNPAPAAATSPSGVMGWAEMLGEALGRGVARGINSGLGSPAVGAGGGRGAAGAIQVGSRRRGRPPKAVNAGPVPPERRCKIEGCGREARSKGLCSAHYQAERRRLLAKSA